MLRTVLPPLLAVVFAFATVAPATAAPQAAVVALGDSAASGEGAGDYAPGTRGEGGDWCHRSPRAYVHATRLAPVAIDLACSGADTADIASTRQYGEAAQAAQLADVARRYRVKTVVLQVGANDDAALVATGVACIRAFIDVLTPPCRQTVGPLVPQRMAATAAKVEKAVGAVRAVMRDAGYADKTWRLVLASYAAPVTERMIPLQRGAGLPVQQRRRAVGPHGAVPGAVGRAARGGGPHRCGVPGPPAGHRGPRGVQPTRIRPRTGSGASRSTRARSSTAGWTRSATTSPRSRSTRRRPRTPRSAGAWATFVRSGEAAGAWSVPGHRGAPGLHPLRSSRV